mmetsp:Transcript_11009/g.17032  ORF Transcript_11009/g.17032 Transcript_11009/m.17032 type:complete len:252 (+) Transcript_11009:67-822(+)
MSSSPSSSTAPNSTSKNKDDDSKPSSSRADEIQFTNAFNNQRGALAAFATCSNEEELHIVRDGFLLGLACDLCPVESDAVKMAIVMDNKVAESTGTTRGFETMVKSARTSLGWSAMTEAVKGKAKKVNSDLDDIWMTLEKGRLEWLGACTGAHNLKVTLKEALEKDTNATDGDISDAKMVWIYALCISIPSLQSVAQTWQNVVQMKDKTQPLLDYNATLWDCRQAEWKPLDLGAQAAAERGGSTLNEAWDA